MNAPRTTIPQQNASHAASAGDRSLYLAAEAEAERRAASIRLALISVVGVFSLYLFATAQISLALCGLHMAIFGVIFVYSTIIFSEMPRPATYRFLPFISASLDVSMIATIAWTYYQAGLDPEAVHIAFSLFLALPLVGTALFTRRVLPVFSGIVAVSAYLLVQSSFAVSDAVWIPIISWPIPLIVPVLLGAAAYVASFAVRNNASLLRRVTDAERRLFSFGSAMPVMTFRLNASGEFIWINASSSLPFRDSFDKMNGRPIRAYLADFPDIRTAVLPLRGTFRLVNTEGGLTHADCIIQPDEPGARTRTYTGTLVDSSEREKAIAQREEMVEKLFQNRQMESLGIMASGMAHDFNNILQTITDISSRVKDKTVEDATKSEMALISDTLTDARFLVSELLALGRKKPLDYDTLDIVDYLNEIVPHFANQLGDQYAIETKLPSLPVKIQADGAYLKRVFQNLFGNARDAMPGGGVITVECFIEPVDGGTPNAVIRVANNGLPIPSEIAERIFEPFYTTKKKGKGTGLGLALCRRVVSLHKGSIRVEENYPRGACFRIEIPVSGNEKIDLDTRTIMLNRIPTSLVILDDDPKIRAILREFLNDLSYTAHEATTAEQALAQLQEHKAEVGVVVMDWRIGAENPVAAIESFRSVKPDILIIVVSGYAPDPDAMAAHKISRWLTKPYEKNQLDFEIQKALYLAHPRDLGAV